MISTIADSHQSYNVKAHESSSPSLWFLLFPPLYFVLLIISSFSSSKTIDDYKDRAESYSEKRSYTSTAKTVGQVAARPAPAKPASPVVPKKTTVQTASNQQATTAQVSNPETTAIEHAEKSKREIREKTRYLDKKGVISAKELGDLKNWTVKVMQWMLEKANYDSVHNNLSPHVLKFAQKLTAREEFIRLIEATQRVNNMTSEARGITETNFIIDDFEGELAKLNDENKSFDSLDTKIIGSEKLILDYIDAVKSYLSEIERLTGKKGKTAPVREKMKQVAIKSTQKHVEFDLRANPVLIGRKFTKRLQNEGKTKQLVKDFVAEARKVHPLYRGPMMTIAKQLGVNLSTL